MWTLQKQIVWPEGAVLAGLFQNRWNMFQQVVFYEDHTDLEKYTETETG